jgi:hypothetical protein
MSQPLHVPVLIAGGGPTGLVLAAELARHGVASMLAERNEHTTLFPKMDITNGASMELLRRLGVDTELRAVGVGAQHSFDVIFAPGLGGPIHGRWRLPSVDEQCGIIAATADGSVPGQPWQRCSQAIFEAMMMNRAHRDPLKVARRSAISWRGAAGELRKSNDARSRTATAKPVWKTPWSSCNTATWSTHSSSTPIAATDRRTASASQNFWPPTTPKTSASESNSTCATTTHRLWSPTAAPPRRGTAELSFPPCGPPTAHPTLRWASETHPRRRARRQRSIFPAAQRSRPRRAAHPASDAHRSRAGRPRPASAGPRSPGFARRLARHRFDRRRGHHRPGDGRAPGRSADPSQVN